MSGLCAYKDTLGRPNEGVHSYRLFGLAVVDLILTAIGGIIMNYLMGGSTAGYVIAPLLLWAAGTFLHYIFCVDTPITRKLKHV